jgi:hypothetical protein
MIIEEKEQQKKQKQKQQQLQSNYNNTTTPTPAPTHSLPSWYFNPYLIQQFVGLIYKEVK